VATAYANQFNSWKAYCLQFAYELANREAFL